MLVKLKNILGRRKGENILLLKLKEYSIIFNIFSFWKDVNVVNC